MEEPDWDHPSLGNGWAVRHVVGHMCLGYHASIWWVGLQIVKERGNVARGSSRLSKAFGDDHSPSELVGLFGEYVDNCVRGRGISRMLPLADRYTDTVIHHEDIRRPLGRDRAMSGRPLGLETLEGDGVAVLTKRIGA